MQSLIQHVEETCGDLQSALPAFRVGDTVTMKLKIKEGAKERLQPFEGIVMRRRGAGLGATFTVRKVSHGIGVERTFPLHTPHIDSLTVKRQGAVRRANLSYLRGTKGKAFRVKEKPYVSTKTKS